jgi:hypothetical protein
MKHVTSPIRDPAVLRIAIDFTWTNGLLDEPLAPFAEQLMTIVGPKFNCHLYDGRVDGYGVVLFPKNRKAS